MESIAMWWGINTQICLYTVKPESGMGRSRVLHRDHLLPIGQMVRISSDSLLSMNRPITRHQRGSRYDSSHNMHFSESQSLRDDEANSETENEFETCYHEKEYDETLEKQIHETNENETFKEELVEIFTADHPDNAVELCNGVEDSQDVGKKNCGREQPRTPKVRKRWFAK